MRSAETTCRLVTERALATYLSRLLGGWHKKAVELLRKLARAQARSTGNEEDVRHLFQRLGVLLVKGNAALLLNR
jgi:hypothetical protein